VTVGGVGGCGAGAGRIAQFWPSRCIIPLDSENLTAGAPDLTLAASFLTLRAMEVNFTPELQAKLERVAAQNSRAADHYVQQLVENYLDHDVWFRQKVTASLGRLDRGEFISHEEIGAGLEKMFQP
jgi:predicted transcriptional regulator